MSFGYETTGILLFAVLSILPVVPSAIFAARWLRAKPLQAKRTARKRTVLCFLLAIAIYSIVCVDAFLVEPNFPVLEEKVLFGDIDAPLQILHLSDLHIETNFPRREAWLLEQLEHLNPDLILVAGDLHQTENTDIESLRHVLGKLEAPLGVYACVGFDNFSLIESAAPNITFLVNDSIILEHGEKRIGICGLTEVGKRDLLYDEIKDADYTIALNHTPDLADEVVEQGIDLYLCGHTHGGQVRIPFWGALITNCDSGKKYEGGWYQSRETAIHTSRGLGLEPKPAPQVRFFCRPEITLIEVNPK